LRELKLGEPRFEGIVAGRPRAGMKLPPQRQAWIEGCHPELKELLVGSRAQRFVSVGREVLRLELVHY
jgi:hypothetical protein